MSDNEKYIEDFVKDIPFDTPDNSHRDSLKKELLNSFPRHRLQSKNSSYKIRRTIMQSSIIKLAAAAVITIALIVGLNQFGLKFSVTSVALADVVKKIEQTTNCVFKKITTSSSEDNGTNAFDSLVYYTQGAMREDMYRDNKLTSQVYVIFPEGIFVGIDHQKRLLYKRNLTDEDIEEFSPISPGNIVNLILSKGKYKKLGRKKVDGIISEGFEFNDKRAMLSMDKDNIEDVTMRLWIDVTTNLPIRIEIDGVYQNTLKANVIMFEPQWNVELEADFFEPIMPSDYTLTKK